MTKSPRPRRISKRDAFHSSEIVRIADNKMSPFERRIDISTSLLVMRWKGDELKIAFDLHLVSTSVPDGPL